MRDDAMLYAMVQNIQKHLDDQDEQISELVTRREHDALDKRVSLLEEYRIAQMQRETERLIAVQQQINATGTSANNQINAARMQIDERTLQWLVMLIIALVGIIGPHIFKF